MAVRPDLVAKFTFQGYEDIKCETTCEMYAREYEMKKKYLITRKIMLQISLIYH